MKKIKIYYWIATGLAAVMLSALSLMAISMPEEAVKMFTHLGYTPDLIPLIVTGRMLAVIVLLIPGYQRLKKWAYAGLVFELAGALYSHIMVGDGFTEWSAALFVLLVVIVSYYFHSKLHVKHADKG